MLLPFIVHAETWVCNQTYPETDEYTKNFLYRFKITDEIITWESDDSPKHDFSLINKDGDFLFGVTKSTINKAMIFTLSLNKKENIFVLKIHDATGIYTQSPTKWSGACEIVN